MKKSKVLSMAVAVCLFSLFILSSISGAVQTEPATLNYQGVLTDNAGDPLTGSQSITIGLYTVSSGGTPFWQDTFTVNLANGRLSVVLGSDANPLAAAQFSGQTYVGVRIGSDPEMTPRQKMTSVAYALNGIPRGGIIMWSGSTANIPAGWALCDGTNETPNLRDRFIVGSGSSYALGDTGGEAAHVLTINEMPTHNHGGATGTESSAQIWYDHGTGKAASGNFVGMKTQDHNEGGCTHTHTISAQGEGAAHNNLPPYYALAYIMKL